MSSSLASSLVNWVKNRPVVLWLIRSAICLMIGITIFFACQALWGGLLLSGTCAFLGSFFFLGYEMSFNAGCKGENFIFKIVRIVMVALLFLAILSFIIGQIAIAIVASIAIIYLLVLSGLKEAGEAIKRREAYLAELE